MRMRELLLLLLPALLLAGCATDRRQSDLRTTVDAYGNTLRWDGLAAGFPYLSPALRARHPLSRFDASRYDQLRVSTYEVRGVLPSAPDRYRQVVAIGLINRNTQTERTILDKQTWRWDVKDKHWWLVSGLPDITRGDRGD